MEVVSVVPTVLREWLAQVVSAAAHQVTMELLLIVDQSVCSAQIVLLTRLVSSTSVRIHVWDAVVWEPCAKS